LTFVGSLTGLTTPPEAPQTYSSHVHPLVRVMTGWEHSRCEVAANAALSEGQAFMVVEPPRIVPGVSEHLRMTISYEDPDEEGWIVVRVNEVPGALSQGRTREEARENVIDALRLMLAPDDDDPSATTNRSEQLDLILAE